MAYDAASRTLVHSPYYFTDLSFDRYLDLTTISTPLAFSVRKDNQLGSSGTKTPFSYSSTIDHESRPSIDQKRFSSVYP